MISRNWNDSLGMDPEAEIIFNIFLFFQHAMKICFKNPFRIANIFKPYRNTSPRQSRTICPLALWFCLEPLFVWFFCNNNAPCLLRFSSTTTILFLSLNLGSQIALCHSHLRKHGRQILPFFSEFSISKLGSRKNPRITNILKIFL